MLSCLLATELVENITDTSINNDAYENFTVATNKSRPETVPMEEWRSSQQFSMNQTTPNIVYHSEGHCNNYISKFVYFLLSMYVCMYVFILILLYVEKHNVYVHVYVRTYICVLTYVCS